MKHSGKTRRSFYERTGKRLLDAFLAVVGIVLTSPVLLLTGVLVRLTSSGPVFFRQTRTGRHGAPFTILKFRTMTWNQRGERSLVTAADDPRITAVGAILRKTKLDEFPQLFNVLRGDMSFVGPRPEVPEYTAGYDARQRRVFDERPGITGPTAITFVNEQELLAEQADREAYYRGVLLPAKLESDLRYCQKIDCLTDLRLIAVTIARVFSVGRRRSAAIWRAQPPIDEARAALSRSTESVPQAK